MGYIKKENSMKTIAASNPHGFPELAWETWFAWFPVKVNGRLAWLSQVFRRRKNRVGISDPQWMKWEYGNLFDYLRMVK